MSFAESSPAPAAPRSRVPATVWIVTVLLALMAFVAIVGSFIFAFPMGSVLGYTVGIIQTAMGLGYAAVAWRLRRGERAVWRGALALPIVHQVGLNTLDIVVFGAIPSENYPFIGVTLIVVILLLLPSTRRFFAR